MSKTCTVCKITFIENLELYFYPRNHPTTKFQSECIECNLKRKSKYKHINENNELLCIKCSIYKKEDEFDLTQNKLYRNNRDTRCKDCKREQYNKRRIVNRGDLGIERLLTERFAGLKDRAIKSNLELDFNKEYLRELWINQEGLCAISKIKMTTIFYAGRTPTNMSVDRIDSNKGYIKGNIQLVCMAINQMKSDLTIDELLNFCRQIIETHENKNN